MAASVIELAKRPYGTLNFAGPFTVTLSTTPAAGDVVVVSILIDNTKSVTAISGLGATWTWTQLRSSTSASHIVAIGEGASASGAVSVTFSTENFRNGIIHAYLVRGLGANPTIVASDSVQQFGASATGPTVAAPADSFVVALYRGQAADTWPSSQTPSGAWTAEAIETAHATARATPSSAGNHSLSASGSGGVTRTISIAAVLGDAAGSTPVALDGLAAAVTIAAPAGTVVAGGAAIELDGTLAAVTISAPLGDVDTGGGAVALDGLPAPVTIGAPLGAVSTSPAPAETPVGLTVATGALTVADVVLLAGTEVPVGLDVESGSARPVVPLAGVTIPLGLSLVGRAVTTQPADPRTGLPQWRYVVTDRDGTPLGELPDIEHDPVDDGVDEPGTMQLRLATSDPARALIKPIERQCEVWEGDQLLLRGPILHGRTTEDGQTVTHQVHDPSWWWRGGRRVIGRIPMLNLLKNGDFTQGLTYWTRGFDADSIPAAKPTVTVVDEDFANDSDGLDPIKAAQIVGVESVTITETELQSSAVYWPNRPFAWEPLEDGFRPEGPAAIDAVANAMPSTAGLKVTIVGHTANDGTGSGLALSLRRAEAAKARVQAIRPGAVITTRGVGFYEPNPNYPIDSQQQRRVVISYESTTTITAQSKQWIRQTITVTQPKSARYPLELTAAAMLKVADDWSIEDANMTAIKVVTRRQGSAQPWDTRLGVGSTSISDTDPVERWLGESASATIPADDRTYEVDVYLYAAAALTRYTAVGLFPAELLYFWGVDQALIVKGGVEHMQDPAMGHGPLGVTTRTPLTGIKRDRVYAHRDRMPMETFFDEWPSLAGGMDIDVLTTRTETIVATFHPRQGQVIDYALVQGGNVVGATPATTDDVGSSIIAQAQDLGSFRREAYARDTAAFDGLLLERVITAEQETPLNELGEIARAELGWAKVSTPSYWLDIHPERAGEVKARIAKGDTVRLVLDFPDQVDTLARVVQRKNHPSGYRLLVALEEA